MDFMLANEHGNIVQYDCDPHYISDVFSGFFTIEYCLSITKYIERMLPAMFRRTRETFQPCLFAPSRGFYQVLPGIVAYLKKLVIGNHLLFSFFKFRHLSSCAPGGVLAAEDGG
jgi:hypothetical protein